MQRNLNKKNITAEMIKEHVIMHSIDKVSHTMHNYMLESEDSQKDRPVVKNIVHIQ